MTGILTRGEERQRQTHTETGKGRREKTDQGLEFLACRQGTARAASNHWESGGGGETGCPLGPQTGQTLQASYGA